jgi:16S rRNA (adenine1518-N6/adenine1519-N6)-dimethyltransferase
MGQNFLIDSNILGVIERAAQLHERDAVLEIGGGLGVLSEYLAERVAHVHVVEIDTRLREALLDATDPHANVSVHWGDAMRIDLAALDPAPTKVVANLPYGIAAGVVLRTIEELEGVKLWVVMVQREVGERLAAGPGSRVYGISSVLTQLAGEVSVVRAIPRTVFRPMPLVDSVLVKIVRTGPAPSAGVRALVGGAFAHRRKTLAGSLALAGRGGGGGVAAKVTAGRAGSLAGGRSREEIRMALSDLGHPENVRAERLTPAEFVALADRLGL